MFPDRNDWETPYRGAQGEAVFRQKLNSGNVLKFYAAFDIGDFELTQEDINLPQGSHFKLDNNNFYTNASYKGDFWKWLVNMQTGLSYTIANTKISIEDNKIKGILRYSAHCKV